MSGAAAAMDSTAGAAHSPRPPLSQTLARPADTLSQHSLLIGFVAALIVHILVVAGWQHFSTPSAPATPDNAPEINAIRWRLAPVPPVGPPIGSPAAPPTAPPAGRPVEPRPEPPNEPRVEAATPGSPASAEKQTAAVFAPQNVGPGSALASETAPASAPASGPAPAPAAAPVLSDEITPAKPLEPTRPNAIDSALKTPPISAKKPAQSAPKTAPTADPGAEKPRLPDHTKPLDLSLPGQTLPIWPGPRAGARTGAGTDSDTGATARSKHIDATTREPDYAAYMAAWVAKVERVGRIHYPTELHKLKPGSALIIDAVIAPDGSVLFVDIVQSSGFDEIDQAARNIIEIAAPYPSYEGRFDEPVEALHITRRWSFQQLPFGR